MEGMAGLEPAPSAMGASCFTSCATSASSLPGESNPDRPRNQGGLLTVATKQAWIKLEIPGVLGGSRTRNRRLLGPPSLPELEYEHVEPPPGADPGRPLYESGAAAVRGGEAGEPGLEPGLFWVRARRVA